VLLIDEAYVDFSDANCVGLVKDFENVIVLRSLSKGYSLAGIRFGYAVACREMIEGLLKVKDSYNVDAVATAVAAAAIKDQGYFREQIEKVKKDRDVLTAQLRALKLNVPTSSANFILAQCRNGNALDIFNQLIERNIYVRYFDLPGLQDKLRISVGTSEQNNELLLALKEILSKQE
jgi:histidinol-phosphate aminotransferase